MSTAIIDPPTDRTGPPEDAPVTPSPQTPRRRIPDWVSLAVLLVATGAAYLWNLSANGWGNSFYAAAIQAGSQSWKAWFFGSSDMANSITVDKPPASLWLPALSVRVYGLNSWSILVPQVLMGVASVALLSVVTRRYFGHWAGIAAGAVLALTPVAALMFRFNNPEALLVLLMIAAVAALLRAVETGKLRWMILCGVAVGFGFLTKQLQVMLIVPALGLTYLLCAPVGWWRRIGHLLAALGALIVSAGWWVLTVELWPADSRPYIGGSQNNSILELTLGYNGLGRLNGNETGSVVPGGRTGDGAGYAATGFPGGGIPGGGEGGFPGGGRGGGMWGETGWLRMFEPAQGGQIAWLIPTAILFTIATLVLIGRAPRNDGRRAYLAVFAGWLVTTMLVFSFMAGIFHSYYTAALAPAVAALVAAPAWLLWRERARLWVAIVLAAGTLIAAIWGYVLLARSADFVPWLRVAVLVVGIAAAIGLLLRLRGRFAAVVAGGAIAAALAGPAAYTVYTIGTPHSGSIVSAGPAAGDRFGPPRGGPRGAGGPPGMGGRPGAFPGGPAAAPGGPGIPGGTAIPGGAAAPGGPAFPGGPGTSGGPGGLAGGMPPTGAAGSLPGGSDSVAGDDQVAGGGAGGLLNGSSPSTEVVAMLRENAGDFTWVAAAVGSNQASGFQLESGYSVMPIGGFNGSDPSPTLEQFQRYVADGKIHYFIGGGGMGGGMGGSGFSSEIAAWVSENFTATTVDGVTLYDLTAPAGG